MTLSWLVSAALVSGLLWAAAFGAEHALRLHGREARGVWAAALVGSWALPAIWLAWRLMGRGAASPDAAVFGGGATAGRPADAFFLDPAGLLAHPAFAGLAAAVDAGTLAALWTTLSVGAVGLLLLGLWRVARERRRWGRASVDGEAVRVSERFGPAVVGVLRPEVVIPRWVLAMDAGRVALAVRHEREHALRRDTLLLAWGYLAAAAAPWNLPLWAQLGRLRRAVELDCDLRVLRSGASRRGYASLLLAVAARDGFGPLPALALSQPTRFLERRIGMIAKPSHPRSTLRAAGALALTAVLVALACEVPAPTAVEDGPEQTPTNAPAARTPGTNNGVTPANPPAIYVDGVRIADGAERAIEALDPNDVERVEIVKGEAAAKRYPDDPRAPNGVIVVSTRKAGVQDLRDRAEAVIRARVDELGVEGPGA